MINTAQTKQEIRRAWDKANMKNYGVTVHKQNESEIIDYIEKKKKQGYPISATFKQGIVELIEKENGNK